MLPVELDGDSERARATVQEEVRDGLRRGPFDLVDAPSELWTDSCVAPSCERAVAKATGADYVIRPRVSQRDNVYTVVLQARDAQGQIVGSAEDKCEICGLTELGELVSARAASLSKQLELIAGAPALISVSAEPDGAEVWVDGQFVGLAPLEYALPPGEHELRFGARGYVSQKRSVTAVSGVQEELTVTLGRARVDARTRGLIIGGAVTLGLGVAGIGGGAPLLALDGKPYERPCDADPEGDCKNLYDTVGPGAGLTAVGAAAVVTGAALLAVGLIRRNRQLERLYAGPSGILLKF